MTTKEYVTELLRASTMMSLEQFAASTGRLGSLFAEDWNRQLGASETSDRKYWPTEMMESEWLRQLQLFIELLLGGPGGGR